MLNPAIILFLFIVGYAYASNIPEELESATENGKTITLNRVPGNYDYFEPSVSPDGRKFAYVRHWRSLWIADVDGSNQVLLQEPTAPANMLAYPRWSPDGTRIAYKAAVGHARDGGKTSLWIVDVATRKATRILPDLELSGIWDSSCAWSPDGSKIAVAVPSESGPYIHIYDFPTDSSIQLRPDLKTLAFPDWSPDSNHILVSGDPHERGEFWTVPVSDARAKPLDTGGVGGILGRYSPDGSWIAFQTRNLPDSVDEERNSIAIVRSNGGIPIDILHERTFGEGVSFTRAIWPSWSSDSRHVMVEVRRLRDVETAANAKINTVAIVDTSGGNFRTLVDDVIDPWVWSRAAWAPDEKMIAYTRTAKDDTSVCIVGLSNGTSKRLTNGRDPTWSPYGTEIAFSRGGNIWSRDMQSGQEFQITLNLKNATSPVWSPLGDLIAFKRSGEIWVVSAYGGESERVAEPAGWINWASDGSALYAHSNKSNDYDGIWGDVWNYQLQDKPNAGNKWGGSQGHFPFVAGDGSFVVSFQIIEGKGLIIQDPSAKTGRIFFVAPDGRIPYMPTVSPSRTRVAFFLSPDFFDPTAWLIDVQNITTSGNALP